MQQIVISTKDVPGTVPGFGAQKSTQGPFQRGGEPSPLCCDGGHQNVQDQVLPGSEQPSLLSALSRRANQAQGSWM